MAETTVTIDQAMAIAVDHQKSGRWQEAETVYRAILRAQPGHAVANHNLGLIALRAGRPDIAADLITNAVTASPATAAFHNSLGEARRSLGHLPEALSAFDQALVLNPQDPFAHNNRGIVLTALSRETDAEAAFRRALELQPQYPDALANLGAALAKAGRHPEAVEAFRAASAMQPNHLEALLGLGRSLAELGQFEDAAGLADRVLALGETAPGFPTLRLAALYAKAGRSGAAKDLLLRALEADPSDALGARPMLAALAFEATPERASDAQMARLYASKAQTWDSGARDYRAAELVARAVAARITAPAEVLDAGCGTGLVGALLRPGCTRLVGVDLSGQMLAQAKAKGVYDQLHQAELVAFLRTNPAAFDAIACAATLIHFGDLAPAFQAAAAALRPHGIFVLTLFPHDGDPSGFSVHPNSGFAQNGVFAHGRRYIAETAGGAGLEVVSLSDEVHEHNEGRATIGLLIVLRGLQALPMASADAVRG